ncbi:MAG: flagellar basal body rod protein FlgB [Deltaproteobacteria bacterium]|nr:flagellar basal body rod protein FlgB [Deltaproteobacteria bacterium]
MSFTDKLFGQTLNIGAQALNLRMAKQGLIQSNIANIETPGYNQQDFSFSDAMRSAMQDQGQLARTNSKHIPLDPMDISENISFSGEKRPVDLDEEMLNLSQNQLMYRVTAKIIAKQFDGLKYAINEGGR